MKIRYDDDGKILAVGDDRCDWQGRVLSLGARQLPDDLMAGFALGAYVVREGKLAKVQGRRTALAPPAAKLLGLEAQALDLALFEAGAVAPAAKAKAKAAGARRPKKAAKAAPPEPARAKRGKR